LELACVEMAPCPLLGVIEARPLGATLWAQPPRRLVRQSEIDALRVRI
jgi:hypothetical protein